MAFDRFDLPKFSVGGNRWFDFVYSEADGRSLAMKFLCASIIAWTFVGALECGWRLKGLEKTKVTRAATNRLERLIQEAHYRRLTNASSLAASYRPGSHPSSNPQ